MSELGLVQALNEEDWSGKADVLYFTYLPEIEPDLYARR